MNAVPKAPIWGKVVSGIHPTSCGLVPLCLPSRRSRLQTWASRAPIPGESQLHVELSSAGSSWYEGMRGSLGCAFARYVSDWRRYNPNLPSFESSCPYALSHERVAHRSDLRQSEPMFGALQREKSTLSWACALLSTLAGLSRLATCAHTTEAVGLCAPLSARVCVPNP